MAKLAPSILSADFSKLGEEVLTISKAGADYVHVDVMDGHFVPNISFGATVMKSLNKLESAPYDVHLMIENPDDFIEDFVTPRTEYIVVHQEVCRHLHRTIQNIKSKGIKAGVSLNPATPVGTLDDILCDVDLVLIMSVNPGFGGQKFIESTLSKVEALDRIRKERGYSFQIEIDGGITLDNVKKVVDAGVDIVVAGSSVFGAEDVAERVKEFKGIIL
ncbi:MAG: ribulose-phosphate 3-epimerase [Anaerovoracaceae bacterium]